MTSIDDISNDVAIIFKKVMQQPNLTFHHKLASCDVATWDSMKNIHLLIEVEKHFKIRFSPNEIFGLPNIGALINLVATKKSL